MDAVGSSDLRRQTPSPWGWEAGAIRLGVLRKRHFHPPSRSRGFCFQGVAERGFAGYPTGTPLVRGHFLGRRSRQGALAPCRTPGEPRTGGIVEIRALSPPLNPVLDRGLTSTYPI